jgi:ligand-binding sensor domain-containing protein
MKLFTFLSALLFVLASNAQSLKVGDWRDHLSYNNAYDVCQVGDVIYTSTDRALFSFNTIDNSVSRLNTINALSDAGVSAIQTDGELLVVGYDNGNIDLIHGYETINIPDIMRASLVGDKKINSIDFYEGVAYLSCGFGIVLVNIDKQEIIDTYYIGENGGQVNVIGTASIQNSIYAATETELYRGNIEGATLGNYQSWEKIEIPSSQQISLLASFNEQIYINTLGPSFNTDVLYVFDGTSWQEFFSGLSFVDMKEDEESLVVSFRYGIKVFDFEGNLEGQLGSGGFDFDRVDFRSAIKGTSNEYWIADMHNGLIHYKNGFVESIYPSGPADSDVVHIRNVGNEMWVAHGAKSENWAPTWNKQEISMHTSDIWQQTTFLKEMDLSDVVSVNQYGGYTYAASWQQGLIKMKEFNLETIYNEANSTLQKRAVYNDWINIGDLQFDSQGNLWCTNAQTYNPLSVKFTNEEWQSFSLSPFVIESQNISKLLIDQADQKWILVRTGGLVVFDEKRTAPNTIKIRTGVGSGNLNSNRVFAISEDADGEIWIGTDDGVCVFYNPENIFNGEEASRITVTFDGFNSYLLDGQQVNDIEVDGANRKWFALNNNGIIVTSENGIEQLYHFTKENSPLFSNKVIDIEFNQVTGEAFFATDQGLISYRSGATQGAAVFSDVRVFPNPVHPTYKGLITIAGLIANASVKITDISGNLIYQTQSLGGQAVWDGKSLSGEKAHTGVYLVFCSDEEGNKTYVTKLLFVRD